VNRITLGRMGPSVLVLIVIALLGQLPAAQASDPLVGTWKLNVDKSTYTPGPPPRSGTVTYEAAGAGTRLINDNVQADGTKRHWEYTTDYDGKDNPVIGDNPYGETVARTRVDARTVRSVFKKGGKATTTQVSVLSADGKTRTVTSSGVNARGQSINQVAIYERQ
jgi:hypothetical protein